MALAGAVTIILIASFYGVECDRAVAIVRGNKISGTVLFTQARKNGPVVISGQITGFAANTHHGFHIHQLGDLSNGCTSAGPHYNPSGLHHGGPKDYARHVGDLGNIQADGRGVATFRIEDNQVMVGGLNTVIGRAVVVHANVDDLGRGFGNQAAESLRTGNAGARIACGVIGIAA